VSLPLVQAGTVRGLAVMNDVRSAQAPTCRPRSKPACPISPRSRSPPWRRPPARPQGSSPSQCYDR
jgi:hypothetical protein